MTTPFPFVAAQVLTANELNSITNLPTSTKTVSYVLVAGDAGKRIVMNAAGSTTITVNTSLFSAGDVVELSNIGAGTCTVTAGTATVSSAGPLAIPQYGGGRLVFSSASAAIYFPSAVTVGSSAVVQVKSTTLTTTFSGTATLNTFLAVTGLTVAITPTSASNKILLIASVNVAIVDSNGQQGVTAIFTGGNSASALASTASLRQLAVSSQISGWTYTPSNLSLNFLDAPATTSATTYGISVNYLGDSAGTKTVYVNRPQADNDQPYSSRTSSTITAIEVTP